MYQHDELLRQMSRINENEILLAYYQSTCGDGRFARFHSGKLETSIVQQVIELSGEQHMRLTDNWGISKELRSLFKIPKLKERFFEIDYDSSYKFFKHYGLKCNGKERDDQKFVHLEINYE